MVTKLFTQGKQSHRQKINCVFARSVINKSRICFGKKTMDAKQENTCNLSLDVSKITKDQQW